MKKLMMIITAASAVAITSGCKTDNAETVNVPTIQTTSGTVRVSEGQWYVLERQSNQYVNLSWGKDEDGNILGILAKRVGFDNRNAEAYTSDQIVEFLDKVTIQDVDAILRFSSVRSGNNCVSIIEKKYSEIKAESLEGKRASND